MTIYNVIPVVDYEGMRSPVAAYLDEHTALEAAARLDEELLEPRDMRPMHAALDLNSYPDWYEVHHVSVLDAPIGA